eukprot:TRINITY_DN15154_c0_g1::TRINITY_DN15154_c0_g1_i1::g.30605::m.30605 TRINITY_DN15154_c0_g1::TRINITY_DN15154_c0_g1_i1::g.30605  ORF type:complete len:393 (-),score=1.66,DnaJ/PF00226.26/2.4e+03,DnaJ/PF00226.26/9e-05,APG6/PF04111.7/0.24,APG6/PF04111.7/74 TRINITY_DN15154_c0_g1_i1:77-1255(-)
MNNKRPLNDDGHSSSKRMRIGHDGDRSQSKSLELNQSFGVILVQLTQSLRDQGAIPACEKESIHPNHPILSEWDNFSGRASQLASTYAIHDETLSGALRSLVLSIYVLASENSWWKHQSSVEVQRLREREETLLLELEVLKQESERSQYLLMKSHQREKSLWEARKKRLEAQVSRASSLIQPTQPEIPTSSSKRRRGDVSDDDSSSNESIKGCRVVYVQAPTGNMPAVTEESSLPPSSHAISKGSSIQGFCTTDVSGIGNEQGSHRHICDQCALLVQEEKTRYANLLFSKEEDVKNLTSKMQHTLGKFDTLKRELFELQREGARLILACAEDPRRVLGVSSSTAKDAKLAFRRLAVLFHPDKMQTNDLLTDDRDAAFRVIMESLQAITGAGL